MQISIHGVTTAWHNQSRDETMRGGCERSQRRLQVWVTCFASLAAVTKRLWSSELHFWALESEMPERNHSGTFRTLRLSHLLIRLFNPKTTIWGNKKKEIILKTIVEALFLLNAKDGMGRLIACQSAKSVVQMWLGMKFWNPCQRLAQLFIFHFSSHLL